MRDADEVPDPVVLLLERALEEADGPVAVSALIAMAKAEGIDDRTLDDVIDATLELPSIFTTTDDRAVSRWVALDGARIAHRLTAGELRHGLLDPGADLAVLDELFDPDEGDLFVGEAVHLQQVLPAIDGDLLDLYEIPRDEVHPDGGWLLVGLDLADASPGDVLVVAVDDREPRLVGPLPADSPEVPDAFDELTARAIRDALLDAWRDLAQVDLEVPDPNLLPSPDQMPVGLDELILEALLRDRRLLGSGSPPLGETLAQAGWATDGTFVGPEGTDFGLAERTLEIAELAMFYRLGEEQAVALGHLLQLFDDVKEQAGADDAATTSLDELAGGDEDLDRYRRTPPGALPEPDPTVDLGDDASIVLSWLVDPDVTAAFVSQAVGIRADHAPALFQFASAARRTAPRSAAAACLWLEAKALDRLGHTLAAAERIDEAVRLDRDRALAPMLLDAANLASDRGDVEAALRFARDAGLDERDDFVRMLTDLVPTAPPGLGRNDPCFCGSGRKYKQCHLGRVDLGLDERAGWLYRKALEWLQDRTWRLRLIELADAYAADDSDDDQVLQLAMHEPFIADLALSDDGAWDDFVADRGMLLPDDERDLAERWGRIGRSVFEVVAVEPGATVSVGDVRADADPVAVVERAYSRQAQVGNLILARVLPAGLTHQFFGGVVAITPTGRDALVEALDAQASGLELARLIGSMRSGPTITNTEGEPLIFCGATYRIEPDAARAALDADPALRPDTDRPTDGEDEGIDPFDAGWVEEITIDGRDWIRARYTLRGDELVLEANSEARIERAMERVTEAIAGAELIDQEQRPLDHLADEAPFDPRSLLGDGPEITPELQAVLDQLTLGAEDGGDGGPDR